MIHAADLIYAEDGLPEGWPHDQGVKSLGYDVLAWAETYLAQPDGDEAGRPWRWRESQARMVAWWFAVDEAGAFLFTHGQIVLSKGSGKSPVAAILACCDLGAPVLFSHWDEETGEPVGRRHPSPDVALAAVSWEQTGNIADLLASALNEGSASEVIDDLDPGIMRVRTSNGGIWRIAAADRSVEGKRTTSAYLDESQHWLSSNRGIQLARSIRRNLAKTDGRALELTNCWMPGEESVAENTHRAATDPTERSETGLRAAKRIMRWHPRYHVEDLTDEEALRAGLQTLYADFPWVNVERFVSEAQQDMTATDIRRFFLNELTAADDALISDSEWDGGRVLAMNWKPLQAGDTITLGFDGGRTDDSTALVACRLEDRTYHLLGLWEKEPGRPNFGPDRWHVNTEAVDARVMHAKELYDVAGFYADVSGWESYIDKWSNEFREGVSIRASTNSIVGWDMRGRRPMLARGVEAFVAAVLDGLILHNGDPDMRRHVLNARRRMSTHGLGFAKESRESPKKVDIVAALVLADMARADFANSGQTRRKRGKAIVF